MLDQLDTGELTLHLKQKGKIAAVKDLDFHKHVTLDGKNLTEKQLDNARLLCQKYSKILSRNSNNWEFNKQIEHQIKLKPDAKTFRKAYGNITFERKTAIKSQVYPKLIS